MRYPADQKVRAREAILQAGAQALRASGFNGIGVDGLAAAAGVTSGAFYSNFSNKEELLKEVIETNLGDPFIETSDGSAAEHRERLIDYLKMYISDQHHPESCNGCVMPTLSADVSRSGATVKQAYERKMTGLIRKMCEVLQGSPDERERKAWTVLSIMVGAVSVAQALPAGDSVGKVIDATLERAIGIVNEA